MIFEQLESLPSLYVRWCGDHRPPARGNHGLCRHRPARFHAESNGTIGIVTPLTTNKATSAIFTENDRQFVFSLSSERPAGDRAGQQPAVLQRKGKAEAQKLAKERLEAAQTHCDASTNQKLRQLKQQLLFSLNSNYDVKDQKFSVTRVVDDQVFTYIPTSITLLSPEANLHGRDARATWHGHLAHAAHISSKARWMRNAIRT